MARRFIRCRWQRVTQALERRNATGERKRTWMTTQWITWNCKSDGWLTFSMAPILSSMLFWVRSRARPASLPGATSISVKDLKRSPLHRFTSLSERCQRRRAATPNRARWQVYQIIWLISSCCVLTHFFMRFDLVMKNCAEHKNREPNKVMMSKKLFIFTIKGFVRLWFEYCRICRNNEKVPKTNIQESDIVLTSNLSFDFIIRNATITMIIASVKFE